MAEFASMVIHVEPHPDNEDSDPKGWWMTSVSAYHSDDLDSEDEPSEDHSYDSEEFDSLKDALANAKALAKHIVGRDADRVTVLLEGNDIGGCSPSGKTKAGKLKRPRCDIKVR